MPKLTHAERGALGGSTTTEAKLSAARSNGKLGGRPGDPRIKSIMAERGCTRQRAHQILKSVMAQPSRAVKNL